MVQQNNETVEETRTFTQEELDVILQSRIEHEVQKSKQEAQLLMAQSLEEREQTLTARENAIRRQEQMCGAVQQLEANGMSTSLAKFLDYTDDTALQNSLKALKKAYDEDVQKGVENRFKQNGYLPRSSTAIYSRGAFEDGFTGKE